MSDGNHLDLHVRAEFLDDGQQRRKDEPLPTGMEVRLYLVNKEHDLIGDLLLKQLGGPPMFLPSPDEKVGETDDTPDPSRRVREGNDAIRHLQRRNVPRIINSQSGGISRPQWLLGIWGQNSQHLAQALERLRAPQLPIDPIPDEPIAQDTPVLRQSVPEFLL